MEYEKYAVISKLVNMLGRLHVVPFHVGNVILVELSNREYHTYLSKL